MSTLTQAEARRIIEDLAKGQPPVNGLDHVTVGLEHQLDVIEREYLGSFVKNGGSSFKLVIGLNGQGKTHFLYCVRDRAWCNGYVVSYVGLSSGKCPFHKLEEVYREITGGLMPPLKPEELWSDERGIAIFLRRYFQEKTYPHRGEMDSGELRGWFSDHVSGAIRNIESISYGRAVKTALLALHDRDEELFEYCCQYLKGEGQPPKKIRERYGLLEKLDKSTAFKWFRALVQLIRYLDYSGLVVLFDEMEPVMSLPKGQKTQHLVNLRQLIDETTQPSLSGVMIFYAIPEPDFFNQKGPQYEALKQRLEGAFDEELNPRGVRIELEKILRKLPAGELEFLVSMGRKIVDVYEAAYGVKVERRRLEERLGKIAQEAMKKKFDEAHPRTFVKMMTQELEGLRRAG